MRRFPAFVRWLRKRPGGTIVPAKGASHADAWSKNHLPGVPGPIDASGSRCPVRERDPGLRVVANVETMLEYRRDLRESKNYTLNTVLRFAF
jgi:hypothetical protein